MHNEKVILFSARDAAAALYAMPIIEKATIDHRFRVVVVAQEPALNILTRRGIVPIAIELSPADDPSGTKATALLIQANEILKSEKPDVIIAGLSSPGQGGIDEALLRMRSCRGLLLQDFWGEWNSFFGTKPDLFLVLDEAAARLTKRFHQADCAIVGSPRHAGYAELDTQKLREMARGQITSSGKPVIGWFGQALHHLPGYAKSIVTWSRSVRDFPEDVEVIYKPHPRESEKQRQRTLQIMRSELSYVHFLEGWPIEHALLLCDCVCAVMSNCLYDAAYLNFHSREPMITPVAILHSAELHADLSTKIEFESLPYVALELAKLVLPGNDITAQLFAAMSPQGKRDCWQAAKENLTDPVATPARILEVVLSDLMASQS